MSNTSISTIGSEILFQNGLNNGWILIMGTFVFMMQLGFLLVEAGSIKQRNANSILLKNLVDRCLVFLIWWAIGYGIAFGKNGNSFTGRSYFFGTGSPNWAHFFYHAQFACTSATIVSGSVAERIKYRVYFCFSGLFSILIYPFTCHWIWASDGWLGTANKDNPLFGKGAIDFAGSGQVHILGGVAGLVGAFFLGPRIGFVNEETKKAQLIPGHSNLLVGEGTLILFCGWFGFNGGSTLALANNMGDLASLVIVNTFLAAASSGMTALFVYKYFTNKFDAVIMCNAILGGLVAVTGPCAAIETWAAVIIGCGAGLIYLLSIKLLLWLVIDDPVGAANVHLFCGLWGMFSTGLFATSSNGTGLFYGGGAQFGAQIVALIILTLYSAVFSAIIFVILDLTFGIRVTMQKELYSLDDGVEFPGFAEMQNHFKTASLLRDMIQQPEKYAIKIAAFHEFLQHEFATENLDFLLTCNQLNVHLRSTMNELLGSKRKIDTLQTISNGIDNEAQVELKKVSENHNAKNTGAAGFEMKIGSLFSKIYNEYIRIGSKKQVNLPEHIVRDIEKRLKNPIPALFDLACTEIRNILQQGPFRRFITLWSIQEDQIATDEVINATWIKKKFGHISSKKKNTDYFYFDENLSIIWVDQPDLKKLVSKMVTHSPIHIVLHKHANDEKQEFHHSKSNSLQMDTISTRTFQSPSNSKNSSSPLLPNSTLKKD